jgi:DNA mismatch repair protein MutL
VLGATVMEHMVRFAASDGGLAVSGLASRPTWTRSNRSQQFLYVNRRPIRNAALSQAIFHAYREVIPPGRHAVVMLFLEIPTGEVDVNVHPAKTEVRLLLERRVFSLVRSALQEGLNLRAAPAGDPAAAARAAAGGAGTDAPVAPTVGGSTAELKTGLARAEADYLRRHFQDHGRADLPRGAGVDAAAAAQTDLFDKQPATTGSAGPDPAISPAVESAERSLQAPPFWQLHRTYILTQIRGGLVLVDQHSSHERILYNQAKHSLESGDTGIPTQQLLFPVHLELTPAQLQAFQNHQQDLHALGFTIQPFGGQSILVQGMPASVKNWAEGQLLLDILDDLAAGATDPDESRKSLLASYACHGAIRAGELLTVPEMQNLIDQLFATDLPMSCPHGRPTMIQFTLAELEKKFGRR